jgi:SRSO17 transposase
MDATLSSRTFDHDAFSHLGSFLEPLLQGIGRSERRVGALRYVHGLILPGERKSIEPMATRLGVNPQSLQQFIADSPWDEERLWQAIRTEVVPALGPVQSWIIDETGWLKQGNKSVGVSHQYCGAVGKQANCQVCVEVVVSDGAVAAPVAGQLYLPKSWTNDPARMAAAKVPDTITFMTKPQIGLGLFAKLVADNVPRAPVLGDAVYGDGGEFRSGLRELGLEYFLQVTPTSHLAWLEPPAVRMACSRLHLDDKQSKGRTLLDIASAIKNDQWHRVSWKTACGKVNQTRIAWQKIYLGHSLGKANAWIEETWLVVDWPEGAATPYHCYLAHLHSEPTKTHCLALSRARWHVEQYFQRGKFDLGLDHYEGRSWSGFHHHLVLSALAYLFVTIIYHSAKKKLHNSRGKRHCGRSSPC